MRTMLQERYIRPPYLAIDANAKRHDGMLAGYQFAM